MRIIAGTAKGTKPTAPEGRATRPVLDRVKESWFAVIGARAGGARVLDLYAGVGSLGLEALSRGATGCIFVESDADCVKRLREHLERARFTETAEVRPVTVEVAVADLAASGARFDLVLVDPPFKFSREDRFYADDGVLARVGKLLAPDGLVTLRRDRTGGEDAEARMPGGLVLDDHRTWGRNEVLFLGRSDTGTRGCV